MEEKNTPANDMGIKQKMMKDYCIIMYSHSSYNDAWGIFFGQIEKYFPPEIPRYLFADKKSDTTPENWNFIEYDDQSGYNRRVAYCLSQIKERYCIFHHEDMPLYDTPDLNFITDKLNLMEEQGIDYIKLIKGGNMGVPEVKYCDRLYNLPKSGDCYFSVQPSLCKVQSLSAIYKNCDVEKIHEFEPKAHFMSILLNHKNLYYYNGEPKRGLCHWDSDVYPYVATAIVKGKWNYAEYSKELQMLHEEYKIDKTIRGEF